MSDEKIDHAALIENARQGAADIREHEHESHHWSADLIDRLRVALEAAQQAPKNLSTESWGAGTVLGSTQPSGAANAHLRDPQALLSRFAPAQQAPAVDREALVKFLRENENYTHDPDADGWVFSAEMAATGLFASGILQDAAVVRSEGYDEGWKDACEEFYPEGAQQAPAVDREAFREVMFQRGVLTRAQSDRAVDALVASGILLDAAVFEARGLEKAADEWQTKGWAGTPRSADRVADRMGASQYALDWMRARAQQVRDGNK